MLKYKYKGNIQTNSWTATIMNNYNDICKLIKSKAIFNRFTEDDYNELYNKIYMETEKEQNMKFNENDQLITYFDLLDFNNFNIRKFLLDYNTNGYLDAIIRKKNKK